jgi:TolB-like protein/Tfp pilus assembly protein PilF
VAAPEAALLSLAESVADGSPVDWAAAEGAAQPSDHAIIRQLRVLAELAVLHRSLPAAPGTERAGRSSVASMTTPAIGSWAHLALIERLGRGTFGEVYRAWDRHLERAVALKLLHGLPASPEAPSLSRDTSEATDDPHVAAILREARLLARVRHANVVHVYGVAVHEGRVGLWMELIRGETLEQLLVRNGPFNAREAALIGIDLCSALAAVHGAGLIHRDVKAQNVMREKGGRIVLMDLGTGRHSGPRALPDFAGTPLYLAPEIFTGAPANERTDVYSLGVLLYHLVTGAFPVSASSVAELEQRHAIGSGVRLRDARADLPTAFVSVVDRALATQDRRYSSAGALQAALVATLDDRSAAAAQDTPAPPAGKSWWLRWRMGVAAAAVAATVALAGVAWPTLRDRWIAGPGPIDSIAVLPFVNLSGDSSQEYFADGMTEAVISTLARVRPLRVISRTSIMQFKGTKQPIGDIATALDVDVVLEAAVLRIGDRVRLSADLVEPVADRHLWADTYERDIRDVLTLQNDLARTVVQAIRLQLSSRERTVFAAGAPVDPAAQDAYLKGRYYWNLRTDEGLQTALEYFGEATRLDPNFARAYAGQADTYNLVPGGLSPYVAFPRAKDAARRALDIDPTLAEAQTSLAFAELNFDRNWEAAEAGLRRAIELSPGYATAHHWYAEFLTVMGRFDDALAAFERAKSLDPLSAIIRTDTGSGLYYARRYIDAIAELRASLAIAPDSANTYWWLAIAYEQAGDVAESAKAVQRGLQLAPRHPYLLAQSARLAVVNGRRGEALAIAREIGVSARPVALSMALAQVYAALGDRDRVLDLLNRADTERSPFVLWSVRDPMYDFLQSDSRFGDLLRRLRLER